MVAAKQKKRKGNSVQDLIGVKTFSKYGLKTNKGEQLKHLSPGEAPKVCFALCEGETVEANDAYCQKNRYTKHVSVFLL